MKTVINAPDRESAIQSARQFLTYYPYRFAGVVLMPSGEWGWVNGKTMARLNNCVRAGCQVWRVTQ